VWKDDLREAGYILIVHVGQLYVDTYLCVGQYICYALDALYIIHLYLILFQIFSKFHTNFFDIFSFSPNISCLWLKPTGNPVKPCG
jgi:hypothetical protein